MPELETCRFAVFKAMLVGDILMKAGCKVRPYEIEPGATNYALERELGLARIVDTEPAAEIEQPERGAAARERGGDRVGAEDRMATAGRRHGRRGQRRADARAGEGARRASRHAGYIHGALVRRRARPRRRGTTPKLAEEPGPKNSPFHVSQL